MPFITAEAMPKSEGLASKSMWSGNLSSLSLPAAIFLARWKLRNSLQKRHFIAAACMVSAQKGHGLVFAVSVSIFVYIGNFGFGSLPVFVCGGVSVSNCRALCYNQNKMVLLVLFGQGLIWAYQW